MNYIVAPLELTAREYEIYRLLYRRMDFKTFEVKYTLDQLVYDSDKLFDFNKTKVNTIIKKFIKNGYVIVKHKGVKGVPTTYEIVKINKQIYNESTTNNKQIINELQTNSKQIGVGITDVEIVEQTNPKQIINELQTNSKQISNECITPIKDKDKEKEYTDQIWKLYPSKTGKDSAYKKIPKIIKSIGFDKLKQCIDNYKEEVEIKRKNGFDKLNYVNGSTFFNGRYIDYLEENYIKINTTVKEENKEVFYNPESDLKFNSADDAIARFKNLINKEN